MSVQTKKTKLKKFLAFAPLILLYASTLNEFDFNYLNYKYFSFNFPFILIYYWSLKRSESLGYGSIFIEMAKSQTKIPDWSENAGKKLELERRKVLSEDDLEKRAKKRNFLLKQLRKLKIDNDAT